MLRSAQPFLAALMMRTTFPGAGICLLGCGGEGPGRSEGRELSIPLSSSCTSCLSTQWPCFWCTQQHTCVSNQSRCEASPNPTVSQAWAALCLHYFITSFFFFSFSFNMLETFPRH